MTDHTQINIRNAIGTYTCIALNEDARPEVEKARDKLRALMHEKSKREINVSQIEKDIENTNWYDKNEVKALRKKYEFYPRLSSPQGVQQNDITKIIAAS